MNNLDEQYVLMAKPGVNLKSEAFKPRDGYVLTGAIPCGPWLQIVYRRADLVAELQAQLDAQVVKS